MIQKTLFIACITLAQLPQLQASPLVREENMTSRLAPAAVAYLDQFSLDQIQEKLTEYPVRNTFISGCENSANRVRELERLDEVRDYLCTRAEQKRLIDKSDYYALCTDVLAVVRTYELQLKLNSPLSGDQWIEIGHLTKSFLRCIMQLNWNWNPMILSGTSYEIALQSSRIAEIWRPLYEKMLEYNTSGLPEKLIHKRITELNLFQACMYHLSGEPQLGKQAYQIYAGQFASKLGLINLAERYWQSALKKLKCYYHKTWKIREKRALREGKPHSGLY